MANMETETLYLARDNKNEVLVENCPKKQHIIHGIRFLYKQYVKKKPGVLLHGNGTSFKTSVVLFISAVREAMSQPVLVLCEEGHETQWEDVFVTHTSMGNDITTDGTNFFSRKHYVYIAPIYEVTKYYGREWGIVVVDTIVVHKEVLRDKLNCRFKVWCLGADVKKDIQILAQLYKWLYPKGTIDCNIFKCNKKDPIDVVTKAVMIEAFLEDILYGIEGDSVMIPQDRAQKVTRKNKDATGTKIKRTKRKSRISSTEEDANIKITKISNETSSDNNLKTISDENEHKNTLELLSCKHIDSSNISIEYEDIEDTVNQRDGDKCPNFMEEDNSMNLLLNFEADEENTESKDISVLQMTAESDNESAYDKDTQIDDKDSCNGMDSDNEFQLKFDTNEIEDQSGKLNYLKSNIDSDNENDVKSIANKIESSDVIVKSPNGDENVIYHNSICKLNINTDTRNNVLMKESEDVFSTESMSNLNQFRNNKFVRENNDIGNENDKTVSTNNGIESQAVENKTVSSFEAKLKEMEEKAMKKFKGSLLDSFF